MKTSEFLKLLKENFYRRLDRKTGWGKMEIKEEYALAEQEEILKMLEENDK